jgi:hypothetical protein
LKKVASIIAAAVLLAACGGSSSISNKKPSQQPAAAATQSTTSAASVAATKSQPNGCGAIDQIYVALLRAIASSSQDTPASYKQVSQQMSELEAALLTTSPRFHPQSSALRTESKDYELIAETAADSGGDPLTVLQANPQFQYDQQEFGKADLGGAIRSYGCRPALSSPTGGGSTATQPTATQTQTQATTEAQTTTPGATGTTTTSSGFGVPSGWTQCPASANQNAAAASPSSPGCGFARATETQVSAARNTFSTPATVGVPYGQMSPMPMLTCVAQGNGETIACSNNGTPWVLVFLDSATD